MMITSFNTGIPLEVCPAQQHNNMRAHLTGKNLYVAGGPDSHTQYTLVLLTLEEEQEIEYTESKSNIFS